MEDIHMTAYNKDFMRRTEYRKARLEMHLDAVRNTLEGYYESILPLIENEDRKCDASKLDDTIECMLDSLAGALKTTGQKPLAKTQRAFYKNFLYLLILSPEIDYDPPRILEHYIKASFGDILYEADILSHLMKDKPERALVMHEQLPWESEADEKHDIIYSSMTAYEELTGKKVSDLYQDKESEYHNQITKKNRSAKAKITIEDNTEISDNEEANRLMPYQEPDDIIYRSESISEAALSIERWKEYLPDAGQYINCYEKFRKDLINRPGLTKRIKDDMKLMLDAYLAENNISAYSLGDYYGLIDEALRKVPGKLTHEMVRARLFTEDE